MTLASPPPPAEATALRRWFLSYSGVSLPLRLTGELAEADLRNRNTWFEAGYAADGRMLWLEKRVYGEAELRHDYHWAPDGQLHSATIQMPDEAPQVLLLSGPSRPGAGGAADAGS